MIVDNDNIEYTVEDAAKKMMDERRTPGTFFPIATQEEKEDIRQEMIYIINEGWQS
jgi:hypothetical protein